MANFLLTDKHTRVYTLTPTAPQKRKNIQTCVKNATFHAYLKDARKMENNCKTLINLNERIHSDMAHCALCNVWIYS